MKIVRMLGGLCCQRHDLAVFGDYFLDACVLAPRPEGRLQTMHSVALERVAFE